MSKWLERYVSGTCGRIIEHFIKLSSYDAQVFITVLDSNDNTPVFSQPTYDIIVSEDTPADTEVLRVSATDLDKRAKLSYSIHGSVDPASMRMFQINPAPLASITKECVSEMRTNVSITRSNIPLVGIRACH